MAGTFRSARLVYRAIEPSEDEAFIASIIQNPAAFINANAVLAKPQSKKDVHRYIQYLEDAALGVVMCLPSIADSRLTPVGAIALKAMTPSMAYHRSVELGIDVLEAYQGQGYGSEAIRWIMHWAFEVAGVHRVSVRYVGWNQAAGRLYERLGFKVEGVAREELWYQGKWWDGYSMGMLDCEWKALQEQHSA